MKKKIRIGRLLLIVAIVLLTLYFASNVYKFIFEDNQKDYVIAVVEGETILNSDVELLIESIPTDDEQIINKKIFLNQTIFNTLLDKKVIESNITIDDETYEEYFQDYLSFLGINESDFYDAFKSDDVTLSDFKELFTTQIKRDIFLRKNVVNNISINEEEISEFYELNKGALEGYNFSVAKELITSQIVLIKQRDLIKNYFEELISDANFKTFLFDDACNSENIYYYYEDQPEFVSEDVLLVKKSEKDLVSFCYKNIPTNTIVKKGFYEVIDNVENVYEIINKFK